ncbi:TIR domain-containing protein [Thermoanaerobacterium sp. R66]|uniref:TIR domain-containing protein n=1 Tax=Thermoanaerobacterium sp. R66 TaxID=2742479 RepID=UPI00237FF133|nr:TIR domain-containing protein [Thermoanaerobacterium sp. R66]MDE4541250.1 hypothetical protein [Thermoanaerobacterium sp. R66]
MSKRVYISADYSEDSGDRNVVETLNKWGTDNLHKVDFIDMSKVVSGSVSNDPDCRPCDLKQEFNRQINASSAVIIVIGDKTASRTAGSSCSRATKDQINCSCTPYKQNINGSKPCKVSMTCSPGADDDVGNINAYSYLRHEFEQAKKRKKPIIVVYNSLQKETNWLPSYMADYESDAQPFWIKNNYGEKVGNYAYVKQVLGYE